MDIHGWIVPRHQSAGEATCQGNEREDDGPNRDDRRRRYNVRRGNAFNTATLPDPYTLLNLPSNATDIDIQKAYKEGSRTLHPDKRMASSSVERGLASKDEVQENFLEFKNAYEILSDPVLRQAYDEHGHFGVSFITFCRQGRSTKTRATALFDTLYKTLHKLHSLNLQERASAYLLYAIRQYDKEQNRLPLHARIVVDCSAAQPRAYKAAMVNKARVGLDLTVVPSHLKVAESNKAYHNKWTMTLSGDMKVEKGKTLAEATLNAEYEVSPGTVAEAEIEIGKNPHVFISSTHSFMNHTTVTTGARCLFNNSQNGAPFSLSSLTNPRTAFTCSSRRVLYSKELLGACNFGINPQLQTEYVQVSFTTLYPSLPRGTLSLNLGVDKFPLRITVSENFGKKDDKEYLEYHKGSISIGLSPSNGIEVAGRSRRMLSHEYELELGISHSPISGLTFLFQLNKGEGATITLPIKLAVPDLHNSLFLDSAYKFKLAYASIVTVLLDMAIGDIVRDYKKSLFQPSSTRSTPSHQNSGKSITGHSTTSSWSRHCGRRRKASETHRDLLRIGACGSREREESMNGLVIVKATYFCMENMELSLDVMDQLQFWVTKSTLIIPASTSKASLPGFHPVASYPKSSLWSGPIIVKRAHDLLTSFMDWFGYPLAAENVTEHTPRLYVRFKYDDGIFEMTFNDNEEVRLPNECALRMGDRNLLQ